MKSPALLLSVLSALSVQADNFVTLLAGTHYQIPAGVTFECVSTVQSVVGYFPQGTNRTGVSANKSEGVFVAGPMEIMVHPLDPIAGVADRTFATFRVHRDLTDPSRTLTLAPTTNAVTVHLEGSTNLVDWTKAASVTLTNVPTATFYRARVE